jgi:DivIVA domain-containing protein
VSSTFPRTSKLGYDVEEVEEFLDDARRAYNAVPGAAVVLSAEDIRHTGFRMRKGGYVPAQVDAALERLEDAFATRERERAQAAAGEEQWYADTRHLAKELLDRVSRPERGRFRRVGPLTTGYHPDDVDRFADRVRRYLEEGRVLTPDDVRQVAFRPKKRGYQEAQVDVALDSVVQVMLALR